jgi:hypothetical protein
MITARKSVSDSEAGAHARRLLVDFLKDIQIRSEDLVPVKHAK